MNPIALLLIRFYQQFISPLLPGSCRFYPSCSQYAVICFQNFGFFHALFKSAYRILRCNPFSKGYHDHPLEEEGQEPHQCNH